MKATAIASIILSGTILLLASCAGPSHHQIDFRTYPKIPDKPTTAVYRLVQSTPLTSDDAFWKNYGGSGNTGGTPADHMDEGFRRHDIVYFLCSDPGLQRTADQALVRWLEAIDEKQLDAKAREYRQRAISFMSSPLADYVGKPCSSLIPIKSHCRDCYFDSPAKVWQFFDPKHTGFPDDQ